MVTWTYWLSSIGALCPYDILGLSLPGVSDWLQGAYWLQVGYMDIPVVINWCFDCNIT